MAGVARSNIGISASLKGRIAINLSEAALVQVWIRLGLNQHRDPERLKCYFTIRRIHNASIYQYRRGLGLCGVPSCPKLAVWPHSKCLSHMASSWAANAKGYRRW